MQSASTSKTTRGTVVAEAETAEEFCAVFDRAFAAGGSSRANVMLALEELLSDLPKTCDREEKVRDLAKAAALSTARSHGNIIETGRILLGNIDELGDRYTLDVRKCKDQAMLGLAEGACQIGPIVYGRFLDIASEYRDNADDWIAKNKRRPVTIESLSLPVIVPFEAELTLSAKPFREPAAQQPEATEVEVMAPAAAREAEKAPKDTPTDEAPVEWSRPKGKGFFRRLSDVMGSLFGRG